MERSAKLEEAAFFLELMKRAAEKRPFSYFLSAFLSAARSVLQYAHRETEVNPTAWKWYADAMAGSMLFQFFKEERNLNIHERPVAPTGHYVMLAETGRFQARFSGEAPAVQAVAPSRPNMRTFYIADWQPETVEEVSDRYLAELRKLIEEGVRLGYVSP